MCIRDSGIPELQWDTIHRIHPTCGMVVPSFLIKLLEFAEKNQIDHNTCSMKKCVCIGEALRNPDFTLNTLGPVSYTHLLFGGLFALCLIYFIQGYISAIAVGAGSAILGIALSYSIHMLAHQNHVSTVQQLIKEITYTLTVGSFTTIGALFGLTFTTSELLRDFGLFASLALIGTTLFCLIYLPHFLKGQMCIRDRKIPCIPI